MAGLGDLMGMMRDFGTLRQRMAEIQAELERQTVEGSAGGGMVTVVVNGRLEIVSLKIAPEAVNPNEAGLLEDLVKAAVGQALSKARDMQREAMGKLLGGMPLPPGLMDMLG